MNFSTIVSLEIINNFYANKLKYIAADCHQNVENKMKSDCNFNLRHNPINISLSCIEKKK